MTSPGRPARGKHDQRGHTPVKKIMPTLLGLIAAATFGLVAAAPAHAAPASRTGPVVVRALGSASSVTCYTGWSQDVPVHDANGNNIPGQVIHTEGTVRYGSNGTNAALVSAKVWSKDTTYHAYTISSHHWEAGDGSKIFKGTGGNFGVGSAQAISWVPTTALWVSNYPFSSVYKINVYQSTRPGAGASIVIYSCP